MAVLPTHLWPQGPECPLGLAILLALLTMRPQKQEAGHLAGTWALFECTMKGSFSF